MEDKSKVIFGNEMSKKTYKKAMQSKKNMRNGSEMILI